MELKNQGTKTGQGEVSLRDLILSIKNYSRYILKNWLFIGLMSLLGLAYFIYGFATHKRSFEASITFMVNEDEGSALGGIASMLGSFGGLLGGAGSEFNLDKILHISTSNRLAEQIVLAPVVINGRQEYLGNHLIESLDTMEEWAEVSLMDRVLGMAEEKKIKKNYRFTSDSLNFENEVESWVLKRIINRLFGDPDAGVEGMVKNAYGELSGIMEINVSTYEEELSIAIANSLFEELSNFYVNKSTAKQKQTYELMKAKHDSIFQELRTTEYSMATFSDRNQALFRKQDVLRQDRLKRDLLINATALGEAKKNLEISHFALQNRTPFVQLIDRPFKPLKDSKPGLIYSVIVGAFLGGLLGVLIIMLRLYYRNMMAG